MTDRECLEQIIKNLGLKRIEMIEVESPPNLYADDCFINKYKDHTTIYIGFGMGDVGLIGGFRFNNNGDIINHGIWR